MKTMSMTLNELRSAIIEEIYDATSDKFDWGDSIVDPPTFEND